MKTLTHDARHASSQKGARREGGGALAALLVLALLALAIWGAWRLGVMAGDQVEWRSRLPEVVALRKGPNPQPAPIPTSRRPGVTSEPRR